MRPPHFLRRARESLCMEIRLYDTLPQEAAAIRTAVFIEEQGFCGEFDETDRVSRHLVAFDGDKAVGTCRVFPVQAGYAVGRIAVVKERRGEHIGARLLSAAEQAVRELGGGRIVLHAQAQARAFYEKQGFTPFGQADEEEGCPHVWMQKALLP